MADRTILFSAPMVRALIAGTKTQTRRILKPQPTMHEAGDCSIHGHRGDVGYLMRQIAPNFWVRFKAGDRLWVRESWAVGPVYDGTPPRDINPDKVPNWCGIAYPATKKPVGCRIRPGIHMPRWASRLTLTVTEVRVERLQDISAADSIAEGMECDTCIAMRASACRRLGCFASISAYRDLWDSINGAGAWVANPWVSATTFTVHHQNIDTIPVLPARYGERSTPTPEEERRLFAFEHNGVRVYHCLRWCGQIVREFAYATDPRGIHEDEGDHSFMFDIRDQPGGKALEKAGGCRKLHEAVIRAALDAGPLVMIPNAPQPPASKPVSSIWDDGEVPF